jgi:hypothetical protein
MKKLFPVGNAPIESAVNHLPELDTKTAKDGAPGERQWKRRLAAHIKTYNSIRGIISPFFRC